MSDSSGSAASCFPGGSVCGSSVSDWPAVKISPAEATTLHGKDRRCMLTFANIHAELHGQGKQQRVPSELCTMMRSAFQNVQTCSW